MPLDPLVKAFLDKAAAIPRPKAWELPPVMARQSFAAMMHLIGPKDVAVGRIENFTIPGSAGGIRARAYAPIAAVGPQPALIYFHGGGFVVGGLESHDGICRLLTAEGGFKVIAVDYRLAPEHAFPAAVDDAWAATTWAAEHTDELGGRPDALAVGGDSAGGNLAAVCALKARDIGLPLALQLLVYPVTDADLDTSTYREFADGYFLTAYSMKWFWDHYLPEGDRFQPDASPLRADDVSGTAPALVITAEFDPLRDEGEAYARRLEEAGVPVTLSRYDGMIHGFYRMPAVIDRANDALAESSAALRAAFA